jgi:hypothetical protein
MKTKYTVHDNTRKPAHISDGLYLECVMMNGDRIHAFAHEIDWNHPTDPIAGYRVIPLRPTLRIVAEAHPNSAS